MSISWHWNQGTRHLYHHAPDSQWGDIIMTSTMTGQSAPNEGAKNALTRRPLILLGQAIQSCQQHTPGGSTLLQWALSPLWSSGVCAPVTSGNYHYRTQQALGKRFVECPTRQRLWQKIHRQRALCRVLFVRHMAKLESKNSKILQNRVSASHNILSVKFAATQ